MSVTALFYLFASNILGGSSYAVTGFALRGLSAVELVFWRTLLGTLCFFPFLIRAFRFRRWGWKEWLGMAAVGLLGYAAPLTLGTVGQHLSSATNASLLIGVEPVSILFLSAVFLNEPLTFLKIGAIGSGLLGAACIVLQGHSWQHASAAPDFRGNLLLFAHGFLWSLYSVIGKPVLRRVDPMTFTAVTTAFALVPITLAAMPSLHSGDRPWPNGSVLAATAFLAFGVTFFGTFSWNKALELVPASQLANFIFVQPLVGVLLGVLLMRDRFTVWSALGGALILLGVYGAMREPALEQS